MKYIKNHSVTDITIAYIGGGSRGWAWGLMSDLASQEQLSGTVRLYDIDNSAAKNNEIIGNSLYNRSDVPGKWRYEAVPNLEQALAGADFIIISILPATFDEMESDVHLPERLGIYQSVGDTTGPGGIIRALRTIPMYIEIAESIKQFAPEAWVINYTNPMTICMRTLYKVFPEIKAFGCCHEVFGTQKLLAEMLQEQTGNPAPPREDIVVNVLGINHFTWLNKASYQGEELLPRYQQFVKRYYEDGYEGMHSEHWINNSFASANRVKFDLFRRYGFIAAAGDRHLAEFVPNTWYLKDPETVNEWKFGLTTVDWRKDDLLKRQAKSEAYVSGNMKFELKNTGEEGVHQIKALLGLGTLITNVNLPNTGQIAGIPLGAVVETNAVFSRNSIRPITAGHIKGDIQSLVIRNVINQETVTDAMLTGEKEPIFNTFMNDPLMNAGLKEGKELFEDMLYNTRTYLPKFLL